MYIVLLSELFLFVSVTKHGTWHTKNGVNCHDPLANYIVYKERLKRSASTGFNASAAARFLNNMVDDESGSLKLGALGLVHHL